MNGDASAGRVCHHSCQVSGFRDAALAGWASANCAPSVDLTAPDLQSLKCRSICEAVYQQTTPHACSRAKGDCIQVRTLDHFVSTVTDLFGVTSSASAMSLIKGPAPLAGQADAERRSSLNYDSGMTLLNISEPLLTLHHDHITLVLISGAQHRIFLTTDRYGPSASFM